MTKEFPMTNWSKDAIWLLGASGFFRHLSFVISFLRVLSLMPWQLLKCIWLICASVIFGIMPAWILILPQDFIYLREIMRREKQTFSRLSIFWQPCVPFAESAVHKWF